MSYVDPLKLVRNPATLQAYRDHQRAVRRAGQPWLGLGLAAMALEVGVLFVALWRGRFGDQALLTGFLVLMFAAALCLLIGGVRARSYRRAHPLVLPEAGAPFAMGGKPR